MYTTLAVFGIAVACIAIGIVLGDMWATARIRNHAYDSMPTTPTHQGTWTQATVADVQYTVYTADDRGTTWVPTQKGGLEVVSPQYREPVLGEPGYEADIPDFITRQMN